MSQHRLVGTPRIWPRPPRKIRPLWISSQPLSVRPPSRRLRKRNNECPPRSGSRKPP